MLNRETGNLRGRCRQAALASTGLRAGLARDQLIFTIICSAAIAVAVVTLAISLSSRRGRPGPMPWQCLQCSYEFDSETMRPPPIDCPECGDQAVRLVYRKCRQCGQKVLMYRHRLTKEGQAQYEQEQKDLGPDQPLPGPGPLGIRPMMFPSESQYWFKQSDGSYAWSPWLVMSPQAWEIRAGLECPNCGTKIRRGRAKASD